MPTSAGPTRAPPTLSDANLAGAVFRETDLRGADLSGANLSGADLGQARVGLQTPAKIVLFGLALLIAIAAGVVVGPGRRMDARADVRPQLV